MRQQWLADFTLRLLKAFCKPEYHADIEGDLFELFERRKAQFGIKRATLLLLKDVVLLFRPGIVRSLSLTPLTNNGMFGNYLKIGLRSLVKSRLYSALNLTGLTFGTVCFLLISLYVYDELTFDQHHTNGNRIYRVITHESDANNGVTTVAASAHKLAQESKNVITEVEMTTVMQRLGRANLVDPEHPVNIQETITMADEHFLQVFDFPLLAGDRRTALNEPNSIVITEDLASRIFHHTEVLDKYLQFGNIPTLFKVTGVLANHPYNSSFNFNSLISEATMDNNEEFTEEKQLWSSTGFTVYVMLYEKAQPDSVASKMTNLVLANEDLGPGARITHSLQALRDVHLYSEGIIDGARNSNVEPIPQGNPLYVTIFSFAGAFVLLIAGINYTNLTTARAASRIKEIGVRKTIGAERSNLIWQFLTESLITVSIALVLAVIIVSLLISPFSLLVQKQFSLFASSALRFWVIAVAGIVLVGILSGSYAALLLSRFKPATLLKRMKARSQNSFSVRKALVVFQFAISTVMIIGTLVLVMQVRFLHNSELGFNKDLMLVIDVNVARARSNFEWVKNEMTKLPSVHQVSVTSRVPGEWKSFRRVKLKKEGSAMDHQIAYVIGADRDFLATYGIDLLQGRNFQSENDTTAILLNETAAKMLGISDTYEQTMDIPLIARNNFFVPIYDDANASFQPHVVGIVKDFHFQSLHEKIQPLVISYHNNPLHDIDYYSVRISARDIQATVEKLKAIMVANDESEPFEYHFLDDQLALFYIEDQRSRTILSWVALASVVIACLGLFGLATYATEQRLKEIGIRKVLGASVTSLIALLSKDFVQLVFVACFLSFPIAWWGAGLWLEGYAYHAEVAWWVYALAGFITLGVALLTVTSQAIKCALVKPVVILKSE